jgi:cytochrome P450
VDVALDEIDLTDLDRFAEGFPHPWFDQLRRRAPVWWHPPSERTPGGEGFWVLSRHAEVVAVAADAATYSSASGGGRPEGGGGTLIEDLPAGFAVGVLLNMTDDPRHRRVRRLLTPSVGARALAALEGELRRRTDAIVAEAVSRGRCDLLVDVATELPLQAAALLMGVPLADRHKLLAWAEATLDHDDHDLGETSARAVAASAEMFEYGAWLVAAKRAQPDDSIISAAVHALVPTDEGAEEPLSELELQMLFNLLVAAGSETTRNAIALGVLALVEHPEQWDLVVAEPEVRSSAVEEVLRWSSSTTYNRRTATADAVLGGERVRAGEKVTLWWGSANRDEDVFAEPHRFDVRRSPNRHVAFGHGPHFCLGAALARIEVRLVLDALADQVARIDLDGPVAWVRSNKHTGLRRLPVRLLPRSSPSAPPRP